MRSRWWIAVAWLGLACSDSHGGRVADDMSASGGAAGSGSALPMQPAVPTGDRNGDRDPPSMAGTGTPSAEAPRDPDLVDRPRDPELPPPAGEDDPPQPDDPDLPPSDTVAEAVLGHWSADGQIGDCIGLRDWYSFEPDGHVINRALDHNACSGVRLVSEVAGVYAVHDRELEITLEGPGSERPFDMAAPLADIARRVERFTFAIGERPATIARTAEAFLDSKAFHSLDGKRFDSLRSIRFTGAAGELLFMQQVELSLHTQRALPLAAGNVVDVTVHVQLSQLDQATGMVAMKDTFELGYPAVVRDVAGWRVLEPTAFTGLSAEETNAVWQALLDDAGLGGHPSWAQRLLQAHFFPSQRHRPGDITVLSSTLPDYGRWTKSADAPPVPVATP